MLPEDSDLQVIEIPDGIKWCIFEQEDGSEYILSAVGVGVMKIYRRTQN